MGQSATPAGGPGARPIPSKRAIHQHSTCTPVQYLGNAPQIQSPHRRSRSPISRRRRTHRSARCGWASPRLRGGAGQPMQERCSSSPYCIPMQYPREGATRPIYEARPTAALVHAELQLECSLGHQSAIPHLRRFSGVRDGKGRQWTERPSTTHRPTLQNGHSGKSICGNLLAT